MRLEEIDFPSDPDGSFGKLKRALVDSLNKAAESPEAHRILTDILKFSTGKLKEAKADYLATQAHRAKIAQREADAQAEADRKQKAARYGVVKETIATLSEEGKQLALALGEKEEDDGPNDGTAEGFALGSSDSGDGDAED